MALPMAPRFDHLEQFIPRARMLELSATVIGLGAVGRQLALQLVALGIPKLQLIDFAKVELADVTSQGFLSEDVGSFKADAVGGLSHRAEPRLDLETICDRFQSSHVVGTSVFCCVGDDAGRVTIWEAVRNRCRFWGDGRIVADTARILVAAEESQRRHYGQTLTLPDEAIRKPKSVPFPYTGTLAAALLVHQFVRYLQGRPLVADASFDLATGKYLVTDERN